MDLREFLKELGKQIFFLLILFLFITLIIIISGCASHEPQVKMYYYDSGHDLFVRSLKDRDVLAPEQAHGFLCLSKRDFERVAKGVLVLKSSCRDKNYPFGKEN